MYACTCYQQSAVWLLQRIDPNGLLLLLLLLLQRLCDCGYGCGCGCCNYAGNGGLCGVTTQRLTQQQLLKLRRCTPLRCHCYGDADFEYSTVFLQL
ncbi:unnamed protein product [Ceratitis capitata]|uniref:(Mediterranean fruit fly) hypothetical protein n=1 Tax=Ceratitis capitata TaxID=7213 RepID=A0A811VC85_CERCA|nr:unnamed protein product [Ceratitis capitata]